MAEKVEKPDPIDMASLPDLIGYSLRCAQVSVFQHFSKTIGEAEILHHNTGPWFLSMLIPVSASQQSLVP